MSLTIIFIVLVMCQACLQVASDPSQKIVNGIVAERERFPYQAAILLKLRHQQEVSLCGGSVIDSRVILTAGHCLWNVENVTLILGAHDLLLNESGAIQIALNDEHLKVHPQFSYFYAHMDVGLILVPEAIQFSNVIKPVALPANFLFDESFAGEVGTVAGYGQYCDSCGSSSVLRYTQNRIMSNEECSSFVGLYPSPTQICVSTAESKSSACRGDSGGALTIHRNNLTVQVGVSSFGATMCEDGRPAVFTRLTNEIVDWIKKEAGSVGAKFT